MKFFLVVKNHLKQSNDLMDLKFLKKTPFYSILLLNLQHLKKLSSPRQLYPIISPIDSSDIQINQEKAKM